LGPVACKRILDERDRGGSYAGLTDLLVRTHIGETAARSLIRCGAFDAFERPRPALMMELNLVCRLPKAPGSTGTLLPASTAVPAPPGDYPCPRKYFDERAILGFSVREHIMQTMRPPLEGLTDADSRDIPSARGQRVRLAGVLEAYRTTRTDKGEPMMFLTMDDEYGLFEVTMFSDLCRRMRLNPSCYGPYVVTGRVEDQYDSLSVTAESVKFVGHSSETAMVI
jgi:DNA polymerase III alpha subunit